MLTVAILAVDAQTDGCVVRFIDEAGSGHCGAFIDARLLHGVAPVEAF
jgi:hypothetical protein